MLDGIALGGRSSGIERYLRRLWDGLRESDADVVLWKPRSRLRKRQQVMWELTARPLRTRRVRPDLVHLPNFTVPLGIGSPIVATVHDVAFRSLPSCFDPVSRAYLESCLRVTARRASHFIANSEYTASELNEYFGVSRDRITVTPLASERAIGAVTRDPQEGLVVAVAAFVPRKNLVRLLASAALVVGELPDARFEIYGTAGPELARLEQLVARPPLRGRVSLHVDAADGEVVDGLRRAAVCVVPSLHEGFGLPVLEAMEFGAPVACSGAGALPEVAGEAALFFDPLDVDDMAQAIARLLSQAPLRQELAVRGLQRARGFTWQRTVDQTLAAYRAAAAAAPSVAR